MENYDNTQELDTLRQQLKAFKERLDRQEIISERMLRKSMSAKASWVKNLNMGLSIFGVCFLPVLVLIFRNGYNVSWGPLVFICLLMCAEAIYNVWSTRALNSSHMGQNDLLTVRRDVLAYKRREQLEMCISVPLCIAWVVWIAFDMYAGQQTAADARQQAMAEGAAYGVCIGGVLGLCIAMYLYRKSMRKIRQIVQEIDEFQG